MKKIYNSYYRVYTINDIFESYYKNSYDSFVLEKLATIKITDIDDTRYVNTFTTDIHCCADFSTNLFIECDKSILKLFRCFIIRNILNDANVYVINTIDLFILNKKIYPNNPKNVYMFPNLILDGGKYEISCILDNTDINIYLAFQKNNIINKYIDSNTTFIKSKVFEYFNYSIDISLFGYNIYNKKLCNFWNKVFLSKFIHNAYNDAACPINIYKQYIKNNKIINFIFFTNDYSEPMDVFDRLYIIDGDNRYTIYKYECTISNHLIKKKIKNKSCIYHDLFDKSKKLNNNIYTIDLSKYIIDKVNGVDFIWENNTDHYVLQFVTKKNKNLKVYIEY